MPTTHAEPASSARAPSRRLPGSACTLLWVLALIVLGCTVTALGAVRAPALSLLDEWTHLDYAWKISHGQVPAAGDSASPEILEERSCRLQENFAPGTLPPCGSGAPASEYPTDSDNYNTWHPPVYYLITGVLARMGVALPLGLDFTTAARLTGALWLSGAMVAMFGVLRLWGLRRWMAAAAAAMLAATPAIAHAGAIVTNDAPAALAGVGALWVLTRVVRQHRTGWVVPTLVAAAIASTKVMSTVAILTVAGVLLLTVLPRWHAGERALARRYLAIVGGVVLAVGAVYAGWALFQGPRGEPGWVSPVVGISTEPVEGLPFDEWARSLFSAYGIVDDYWLPAALTGGLMVAWVSVYVVLMISAPVMTLAAAEPRSGERLVGAAALAGPLATVLLIQVRTLVERSEYFPFPTARYAVTLVPLTLACLALVAHHRRWRVATAAVASGGVTAVLIELAGLI